MSLASRVNLRRFNESTNQRIARRNEGQYDLVTEIIDHLSLICADLDATARLLPTMSMAEMRRIYPAHKKRQEQIWYDYVQLRDNVTPKTDADRLRIKWIMWCTFVRQALIVRQIFEASAGGLYEPWPACLVLTANEFLFVSSVAHRKNVCVSTQAVGTYSPRTLTLALTALVDALDRFGWSPSAHAYFMALFWRYALLVHWPDLYAQGDAGPWAAPSLDEASRLLHPALLTDAFVDMTERLLFHHYFRFAAQRTLLPTQLIDRGCNVAALQRWSEWRRRTAVAGFTAAITEMLKHEMLREEISDRIISLTAGRFLYPGEHEQMRFTYPDEATSDASSTLFRLRPDMYMKITGLQKQAPIKYVKPYMLSVLDSVAATGRLPTKADATLGGVYEMMLVERDYERERLIMLLFEACFDMDCNSNDLGAPFCAHAYVDDRSPESPGDRPPSSVTSARQALPHGDGWPLFVAIWNCYYVISGGEAPVIALTTPHLLDALATWMALASRDAGLKLHNLKGQWASCLANLPLGPEDACLYMPK